MGLKAIPTTALPLRQWPAPGEWTYQDYLDLPDDGNRYEIIWGERFQYCCGYCCPWREIAVDLSQN